MTGIVSEGDLIHRHETMTERHGSWLSTVFESSAEVARAYTKAHGRRASDIMTRQVVTVNEATPLSEIADIMATRKIKRVPVVDADGEVLGIVSRADLLRALLRTTAVAQPEDAAGALDIRERILQELRDNRLTESNEINVIVAGGVVELWGMVGGREQHRAIVIAAENTPGVTSVLDHIAVMTPLVSSGL